jgi:hypothetical protein
MTDAASLDLLVLVLVLIANRTIVRSLRSAALFWTFQAGVFALAVWFAWHGVAGLEGYGVVRWIVPGLLVFHIVQNVVVRKGGSRL